VICQCYSTEGLRITSPAPLVAGDAKIGLSTSQTSFHSPLSFLLRICSQTHAKYLARTAESADGLSYAGRPHSKSGRANEPFCHVCMAYITVYTVLVWWRRTRAAPAGQQRQGGHALVLDRRESEDRCLAS